MKPSEHTITDDDELRVLIEERLFYGDAKGAIALYRENRPALDVEEAKAFVQKIEHEMAARLFID